MSLTRDEIDQLVEILEKAKEPCFCALCCRLRELMDLPEPEIDGRSKLKKPTRARKAKT